MADATWPLIGTQRSTVWGSWCAGSPGSAVILASGRASTESLGLVRMMLGRMNVTAAVQVPLGDEAPLAGIPDLALRRERAPNLAGAELLGYKPDWAAALEQVAQAGLTIVLDADLTESDQALIAGAPGSLVVLGTVLPEGLRNAELVLPTTNMAEENGTYVNRDRRIQRYQPGQGATRHGSAGLVGSGGGSRRPGPSSAAPSTAGEAFALLGERWPAFAGFTHADLGYTGRMLGLSNDRSAESQAADLGVM